MREFFAYRIQDKVNEFTIDSYTMVESERLRSHRQNQPKLRVAQYKGLHECLVQGQTDAIAIGQRIIL